MLEYGGGNVVFSSSATVYGQPDILPVTEDTPRGLATNPYGHTKQICEDILVNAVKLILKYKASSCGISIPSAPTLGPY